MAVESAHSAAREMALRLSGEERENMEARLSLYQQATERRFHDQMVNARRERDTLIATLNSRDGETAALAAKLEESKHLQKQAELAHKHELNLLRQSEATIKAEHAKAVEEVRALQIETERLKSRYSTDMEAEVVRRTDTLRADHAQDKEQALLQQKQSMLHDMDILKLQLKNEHTEATNAIRASHLHEVEELQSAKEQLGKMVSKVKKLFTPRNY